MIADVACAHQLVYIGDRNYTLRKARQVARQSECKHCGRFFERTVLFIDFGQPFAPEDLARIRREETEASPVERRKRERAAGMIGIGEPEPILYTPPPSPNPAWLGLGRRLRDARVSLGRGLREVADAAAIGPRELGLIQLGRALPTPDELDRLAGALGLAITDEDRALVAAGKGGAS